MHRPLKIFVYSFTFLLLLFLNSARPEGCVSEKEREVAEGKTVIRQTFIDNHKIQSWAGQQTLAANPFPYKDKIVGVRADFEQMVSATEARFGQILVSGVPTSQFTVSGQPMVLAVRIEGLKPVKMLGTDVSVPYGTFIGVYRCKQSNCSEFFDNDADERARAFILAPKAPLGSQLTANEMGLLRGQLYQCWNVPAGVRDAKDLVVEIRVSVAPDRTVRQACIVDQGRLGDPLFRAVAESARRTFFNPACTPLKLPADKYEVWKDLVVGFNPKDIL